jgi:vancomycin aglycone glucosyltransferase
MRALLSTYGSRGDVEPMVGLAVQLGALGAEVRVCAPPDFAELPAGVGVPLVPIGQPVRLPVTGATPSTERTCPRTRPSWSPPSSKPSPRRPRNVMRRSRRA